jgi:hypothetical protein
LVADHSELRLETLELLLLGFALRLDVAALALGLFLGLLAEIAPPTEGLSSSRSGPADNSTIDSDGIFLTLRCHSDSHERNFPGDKRLNQVARGFPHRINNAPGPGRVTNE